MEQKQNINDFIMLHQYNEDKIILRISDIKIIIQEENYSYIEMNDNQTYFNVKETVPEIFKMINK